MLTVNLTEATLHELVRASETNVITSRSVIHGNTRAGDNLLAARLRHNAAAEQAHDQLLNAIAVALGNAGELTLPDPQAIRRADEGLRRRVERIKDPALRAECLAML